LFPRDVIPRVQALQPARRQLDDDEQRSVLHIGFARLRMKIHMAIYLLVLRGLPDSLERSNGRAQMQSDKTCLPKYLGGSGSGALEARR
jgi:hypothetical protein